MDSTCLNESTAGKNSSSKDDLELIRWLAGDNFSVEEYRNDNSIFDCGDFPSVEIALERVKEYYET